MRRINKIKIIKQAGIDMKVTVQVSSKPRKDFYPVRIKKYFFVCCPSLGTYFLSGFERKLPAML